jgi:hypothetical protein
MLHTIAFYSGGLLVVVAHLMLTLTAFRKGILWGLGVFFIVPLVPVVFVILNWRDSRRAVLIYVVGSLLAGFGMQVHRPWEGRRSSQAVDV